MKVHIDLNNPYTRQIDVEAVATNDEVRTGTLSYKSNRRALSRILELLDGMTSYVRGGSSLDGAQADAGFSAAQQEDADLDFSNTYEEPIDGTDGAPAGGADDAPDGGSNGDL